MNVKTKGVERENCNRLCLLLRSLNGEDKRDALAKVWRRKLFKKKRKKKKEKKEKENRKHLNKGKEKQ